MPTKKALEKQLAILEDEIDELQNENANLKIDARTKDELIESLKKETEKCTELEIKNKNLMKDIVEMNDKITGLSQKMPKGTAVQERFQDIIIYDLAGETLQRETVFTDLDSAKRVLHSLRSSLTGQGATNIRQKIRPEVTYEYEA